MCKSIFMYSLFAVGTLVFSTLPFTEVSAQITITLDEDTNNQETTQGGVFGTKVKFTIGGLGTNDSVTYLLRRAKIGTTKTGTFVRTPVPITANGDFTRWVQADDPARSDGKTLFDKCFYSIHTPNYLVSATFEGRITDVLYFSSDDAYANRITETTRSVAEGTAPGTAVGAPVKATHWALVDNADLGTADPINLVYSLEGTHASSFSINSGTGQLSTTTTMGDAGTTYSVTVKVQDIPDPERDPRSSATIEVPITVTEFIPPPQPPADTQSPEETSPQTPQTPPKRRIVIQECPVGWIRSDGFAGRTRRALLYEVRLEMDLHNPISVYKPGWIAIYVHPNEELQTLDGWKLQVAIPYNHHREYLLTAENSVVVDAGFVEGGFAFIENPQENPFPMVGIGFTGSPVPGFDYRLYDETGRRVDFGISCYKRFDVFQVLKGMEDPRVLRKVLLESFDWDSHYLRSEWTVPMPVPAAPSLIKKNIVGTWADLKKQ